MSHAGSAQVEVRRLDEVAGWWSEGLFIFVEVNGQMTSRAIDPRFVIAGDYGASWSGAHF